jgi:predicted nucleotidyltransferase
VEQTELLRIAVDSLEQIGIPYLIVGSYGSAAYGEPRFTQDIDIVVELSEKHVKPLCQAFSSDEYYISESAALQAARQRVPFNVIHSTSGNKIDLIPSPDDEWGRTQMRCRRLMPLFPDRSVYVARPEDVIIGKMLYYAEGGSEKHLRDITGILRLCPYPVDREDIAKWAEKLGVMEVWQAIVNRLASIEKKAPE